MEKNNPGYLVVQTIKRKRTAIGKEHLPEKVFEMVYLHCEDDNNLEAAKATFKRASEMEDTITAQLCLIVDSTDPQHLGS